MMITTVELEEIIARTPASELIVYDGREIGSTDTIAEKLSQRFGMIEFGVKSLPSVAKGGGGFADHEPDNARKWPCRTPSSFTR
jgi:hypothetical protein